jgi:hypothetical protein
VTPGERLVATIVAALEAADGIAGKVPVFDAPPARGSRPHLVIDEPVQGDWGAKGVEAREYRVTVRGHDSGERPVRLRGIGEAVDGAVRGVPRDLGEGWGLASVALLRRRTLREGGDRWVATSEWRVRIVRTAV